MYHNILMFLTLKDFCNWNKFWLISVRLVMVLYLQGVQWSQK